jgi:hypothetical protein
MLELSDEIDRAVSGLRARRSPSAGAEARVLAALELRLAGPPAGGDGGGASAGPGAIDGVWVAKVVGATAAMTAGGLALVRAGAVVLGLAGSPAEPVRTSEVAPVAASEVVSEQPQPPLQSDEPIAAQREVAKPQPRGAAAPEAAPKLGADDLEAELALIREARTRADPSEALELLDEHARDFAVGTLADEREALRAVALCKLERLAEARAVTRSLAESRPSSPLLDRVHEGCPALADG